MELVNKTQSVNLKGAVNNYTLDYGNKKQGTNGDVYLKLMSTEDLLDVKVQVSCGGCTKAEKSIINSKEYDIKINYKTSILGRINKNVFITTTTEAKKNNRIVINLQGNITK